MARVGPQSQKKILRNNGLQYVNAVQGSEFWVVLLSRPGLFDICSNYELSFGINVCGKLLCFAVCCIVIHSFFNFMVGRTSIRNLAFASLPLNSKYLGVFNTDTSASSSWKLARGQTHRAEGPRAVSELSFSENSFKRT